MHIPATEESFQHVPYAGVERAQGFPEALVPEAEEILEAIPDDLLELIRGRAGPVAGG